MAENVKDAVELIKWYRSEIKGQTWTIGENWRFLNSYTYAAKELKSLGKIIGFQGRQQASIQLNWKFNRESQPLSFALHSLLRRLSHHHP